MQRQRKIAIWLGVVSALLLSPIAGYASDRQGDLTDEFHQVYPLSAEGRIDLENINGSVRITGWDRNEVKVDAVKHAWSKERLDEAKIQISASPD